MTKLSPAGDAILYSTFIGGTNVENRALVTVDSAGDIYLAGNTYSNDFPTTTNAFRTTVNPYGGLNFLNATDGIVAKIHPAGAGAADLVYSTYLATHGGSFDAYVARIDNPSSFSAAPAPATEAQAYAASANLPNPIDDAQKFVRQQYLDFLNREPDTDGLAFWTNEIAKCGTDAACVEVKRINVSAAFFLSIEFQQTGYLVHRLYRASYARAPRLTEFSPDTRLIRENVVVNVTGWEQQLEANKRAFAESWVQRADFRALYDGKSNAEYVDALFANAGVQPSTAERSVLVDGLVAGTETRATVLRKIAENDNFARKEFNKAFVLMQYFGYLQRSPDDPPDADLVGYNFWLSKLDEFDGNFVRAEMVRAFISAGEYRKRFGQD